MSAGMDQLGMNFTADGSTMSRKEVEKARDKKGECITCGQKLYERKMFQKVPITVNGLVLNGRCLNCKPLSTSARNIVMPAAVRTATSSDLKRYNAESTRKLSESITNSRIDRSIRSSGSVRSSIKKNSSRSIDNTATATTSTTSAPITEESKKDVKAAATIASSEDTTTTATHQDDTDAITTGGMDISQDGLYKSAIGNIAAHKLAKRMLNNSNVISEASLATISGILSSMQRATSFPGMLKCLTALAQKELNDEDCVLFIDKGGLEVMVKGMSAHESEKELVMKGLECIHNLAQKSEDVARSIVDNGGLDVIVSSLKQHPCPELTQLALEILSNVGLKSSAHPESFEPVLQSGTIPCIIEAMNTYLESYDIQNKACNAITNFSSGNSSKPVKDAVVKAEGLNAINIAMMMHGSHSDFIEAALSALRNLCKDDEASKVLVAESGGIDNAIKAMQDHRDEVGVQEKGCWALSTLAVNTQNKLMIGDLGGIDVIVRALWVHIENASLVEWASHALWTLSVDPSNRERIVGVGGITAIVSGMRAHQGSPEVQGKSCGVFANLSSNSDPNRIKIVNEEGLDVIIMAMILHPDHPLVQQWAVTALRRMTSTITIQVMKECGVEGVLISAKEKFPKVCKDKADFILGYEVDV